MVSVLESLCEGGGTQIQIRTCSPGGPRVAHLFLPLCFFYLFFLSGGLCVEHKDVQRVSPSCASGAMNCLITAASSLPGHPSSVKQNFLSVWSPRHHFHICIFLLLISLFYPFRATGASEHIMRLFLVEAGWEMESRRLALRALVPRERQIAHLIIHDTDGNIIGQGRKMRREIKREAKKRGQNVREAGISDLSKDSFFPQTRYSLPEGQYILLIPHPIPSLFLCVF